MGLQLHHECTHPYVTAVTFQEERFEYGFRAIDIPKESRQALRAKFGKEMNGWPLLKWRSCLLSFWPSETFFFDGIFFGFFQE